MIGEDTTTENYQPTNRLSREQCEGNGQRLPDKLTFVFSVEQINGILGVMAEAPVAFRVVNPLVVEIQRQAQEQINQRMRQTQDVGASSA